MGNFYFFPLKEKQGKVYQLLIVPNSFFRSSIASPVIKVLDHFSKIPKFEILYELQTKPQIAGTTDSYTWGRLTSYTKHNIVDSLNVVYRFVRDGKKEEVILKYPRTESKKHIRKLQNEIWEKARDMVVKGRTCEDCIILGGIEKRRGGRYPIIAQTSYESAANILERATLADRNITLFTNKEKCLKVHPAEKAYTSPKVRKMMERELERYQQSLENLEII